ERLRFSSMMSMTCGTEELVACAATASVRLPAGPAGGAAARAPARAEGSPAVACRASADRATPSATEARNQRALALTVIGTCASMHAITYAGRSVGASSIARRAAGWIGSVDPNERIQPMAYLITHFLPGATEDQYNATLAGAHPTGGL